MLFIGWALAFIYHSSYDAMDGRRYFNLFDDAMISMRYAWNFSRGHGLVWNVGERVEGYTNLLMTLLMSLAVFVFDKRYAVLFIQLTGILFMLGTAFFTLKIFQSLKVLKYFRISEYVLFGAVLLYYPLNYWSLLGMETGLLAFLLSAGVLCSLVYVEKLETKYLWLMSVSFGLCYLTRNDSLLFAVLVFLYLTDMLKWGRKSIYAFFAAGLVYGLFVIGQTVFRYAYYGEMLPNTYILKLVGMPLAERLQNGWGFVQPFLEETSFILLLSFVGIFLKISRQKLYLFSFFLISLGYQIYVGGDPWNYWRMMSPTMPFLLILFVLAGDDIFNRIFNTNRESENPTTKSAGHEVTKFIFIVLIFGGLFQADFRFLREMSLTDYPFDNEAARKHVDQAIAINAVTDENASIGVFWAGTLPYYVDRVALDFLGKSDPYIANLPPDLSGKIAWDGMNSVPGHNKYDLNYSIKELLPTYVQGFEWGSQNLSAWAGEYYVLVKYKGVRLFLLKDSPNVDWEKFK